MKNLKVIIIAITCFLSLNLLSQNEVKSSRFVQYGYVGLESGYINNMGGTYVLPSATIGFKKGFELSMDYKALEIEDPTQGNYYGGIPFFIEAYEKHVTEFNSFTVNFGKSVFENEAVRIVLSAGPSFIQYNDYESSGFRLVFIGDNTKTESASTNITGADLKAKFDFVKGEVIGASLVLNGNINSYQNYFGAGLALTFGKLK